MCSQLTTFHSNEIEENEKITAEQDNRNVGALIQPNQYKLFIEIIFELCREPNDVLHSTLRTHFVFARTAHQSNVLRIFCLLKLIVIGMKLHMT